MRQGSGWLFCPDLSKEAIRGLVNPDIQYATFAILHTGQLPIPPLLHGCSWRPQFEVPSNYKRVKAWPRHPSSIEDPSS
jgi:hypothetical protein